MDPLGNDRTVQFLHSAMRVASKRHTLIAGNIANLDTPGYRSVDFSFEEAMREIDEASTKEMNRGMVVDQAIRPEQRSQPVWTRFDDNRVDLEQELTHLHQAHGRYNAALRLMQTKVRLIRDQVQVR
jgi:flagellar basal-body rod protein FlgB